jgi:hypothetical protein
MTVGAGLDGDRCASDQVTLVGRAKHDLFQPPLCPCTTPATPARPDLLQLHLDLIRCVGLPVSFWLGLHFPLHPRGVLPAGIQRLSQ